MRVFLTRDVLIEQRIRVAERATVLTGRPDCIQVSGYPLGRRIFRKGQWFPTLGEARAGVLELIRREREHIARQRQYLDKLEATLEELDAKYNSRCGER